MKHDKKKQWLSIGLLTLGAAALAVFAAATLDAGDVRASLAALLPGWTAAIVGCMLLYYLCDALKYQLITRAFGCAQPLGDSIDTSMIGFFYSAVTPAAAGGQPFQVLHMHHRGIPTGTATSVICTTYCLWNVALVTLGIVGMCLCGGKLAAQSAAWIPVLALGLLVHAGLLTLVLLSAILTGFAVYDDIAKFAGAGTLVPITGFANSVVSPAIDFKAEGIITGMAAKMFVIAGPVIVFGTLASVVYGAVLMLMG